MQLREIPQVVGEQLPQMLSSFFGATYFQEAGNVMERMLTKRAAEDLNLSEQEFMNLSSKEQGDAMFNIIKDGRAEDILDKSVRTGVINQGLDFAGAAVLVGKAAKFIPKDAWRRALKGNFKPIKKEIGSQAAGTGAEVGTEITQEINSAITAEDPITRELLLETAAQTAHGTRCPTRPVLRGCLAPQAPPDEAQRCDRRRARCSTGVRPATTFVLKSGLLWPAGSTARSRCQCLTSPHRG